MGASSQYSKELNDSSTGENILDLSWKNVLAFSSDNVNVMAGKDRGVAGRITQAYPHV